VSRFTEDNISMKEYREQFMRDDRPIPRPTKWLNRAHKRANHRANMATRAQMNQAADLSKSNPRPGVIVGSAAPYRPIRYTKKS